MSFYTCSDGSIIHYNIVGEGTPIVFLHGWSVDLKLWLNKIESIPGLWQNKYKRIYIDLPGMGKSVAAKRVTNSDHMLENIIEIINDLLLESDYLLAGESYGGYLSRGLLKKHISRIKGLFLLCPLIYPGWRNGKVPEKVVLEKDDIFVNNLSKEERDEFDYISVIQTEDMWIDYKKDIDLSILKENTGFLEKQLDGSFTEKINLSDIVYDEPTLILLGRQDAEVGFEDQYKLYKSYSRATIQILDKAGHNLQIERNPIFNVSFLDWLERIETAQK